MLNRCGNRKYTRGISVNKLKRGCALGGGGERKCVLLNISSCDNDPFVRPVSRNTCTFLSS